MPSKSEHPLDPYIEQWNREIDALLQATAVDYSKLFGPLPTPKNPENERPTE